MHLLILGPPGAGKGTQAEKLVKKYKLVHVSTGDILREAVKEETTMGLQAKEYMDKGFLVPDEVVIGIIRERMQHPDCQEGALFDGFPRNLDQAEALDNIFSELKLTMQAAIDIEVAEEELVRRLTGRRVCRQCGATFHLKNNPSKVRNICDHCGGELYQRDDDTIDTVQERLEVYKKNTAPLIDYYKQKGIYYGIDGSKSIDEVFSDIIAILEGLS